MHIGTKLTPLLRKEIYKRWKKENISQRSLVSEYHVDKRIIGRIIERGKQGEFSVHNRTNKKYLHIKKKNSKSSK